MNETNQERLAELEQQVKDLHSLSGGLVKLLLLSLAYHSKSEPITTEQKELIREKLLVFMDEPALEIILAEAGTAEEITDIVKTMALSEEAP